MDSLTPTKGWSLAAGKKKKKKMRLFDANNDGRLSVNELIRMFDDFFESHLQEDDIHSVLSFVNLPLDDAGMISIQDFVRADTASIRRFLLQLLRDNPSKLSRHSRMAWINIQTQQSKDDVDLLESIERRVAQLTQLPKSVVSGDMEMQIVHYSPNFTNKDGTRGGGGGGHYTAHFDSLSPTIDVPCCHTTKGRPPCRPCRLATILYNLSDGDGDVAGGHTAFPLSGKTQEECSVEAVEAWKISAASRESSYCASTGPGLRVEPQLGQAVLWYNHNLITADDLGKGVLGELDRSTLHAGCPSWVARDALTDGSSSLWNGISGKWIANHWISDVDQGQQRGSGFP
uniref:EF-hand domain-containing protein n=1 Tax=Minutocellus polymorphus TaxID=265543 RepID=A0A7S0FRE1_9STRA|mmetsp:Transcript_5543/g.9413  ORF Transcript_5543/g.9413 Transcript_5543/m.9413 type:complete len:344 (+) Transcript_5543:136-1167(+)